MDTISEYSSPISSISQYNNRISQILDERSSDNSIGDNSETNSPAATLLKSYLRDSQRFTSNISPAISRLNESIKEIKDNVVNNELSATPKSVKVIKKKRFDVSSPSAILRERNPFPKEVFDDVWMEEEELPPPLPFNELLKDLHMYAEVRDKEDNRSAGIKTLLRSMGAIVHDKLDSKVTHVIFREGQLSTYRKAKKQNCHLLSMLWLHAVRNTGRRVPEQNYPALNLDIYESPVAVKKFRKFKSMQPDYEDLREDYHRKRLEKIYKQKLAVISSTNGSDSDDKSSISIPAAIRKRKSDIIPNKTNSNKRRRRTIMSTTTMESDETDENISRKQTKSNKKRKTEICHKSSILNRKDNSPVLKEKNPCTKNTSSVLENRNVVVNQTLRPSDIFDLIQGSQEISGSTKELKPKKINEKSIENNDCDSDLYSPSIKNRNVVVNCTLTPPRIQDVLDRSQDNIGKAIKEYYVPQSNSSDTTSQTSHDNDFADSADLKRVLEAIQNDNSGSLRKKLLKGLGIQCHSEKKGDAKKAEVFSFVAVGENNDNLRTVKRDESINKNTTASTIWGDSPLLNCKNNENEEIISNRLSSKTRFIRTPRRYLNDFENYESSPISIGRKKTFEDKENIRKQTRMCQKSEDDIDFEKTTLINNSESNLIMKRSTITSVDKEALEVSQKVKTFEENKTKRKSRLLFRESNDECAIEMNSLENSKCNLKIKQSMTDNLDREKASIAQKVKTFEENKDDRSWTRRRTQLFQESNDNGPMIQSKAVNLNEKELENVSDEESLKDIINKRVSATEPRKINTRRSVFKNSKQVLSNDSTKLHDIKEDAETTGSQTELKSKSSKNKISKIIPASEPSKRSSDRSRMSKKVKLFDPTLSMIDSDLSLPEASESIDNPYELDNKTPKRRKIDLKEDKNRRSTFWFQTPEENKKSISKKYSQNIKASQKKLPTIVCTRLHSDQIDVFNQIVKKLGGFEIENSVSSCTSHLVVGEPSRTLNMLRAIIRGCWIVSYEWLLQSLEVGEWLKEELYEVTEFSPAVKKCRIERQTFGEPYTMNLFNECGKIYIGTQTSPKSSDLEQLVKLAGGTVVSSPRLARIIVGQSYSSADNGNIVCVTEKWILESISHKSVKSFKKFLLSTNNVDNKFS